MLFTSTSPPSSLPPPSSSPSPSPSPPSPASPPRAAEAIESPRPLPPPPPSQLSATTGGIDLAHQLPSIPSPPTTEEQPQSSHVQELSQARTPPRASARKPVPVIDVTSKPHQASPASPSRTAAARSIDETSALSSQGDVKGPIGKSSLPRIGKSFEDVLASGETYILHGSQQPIVRASSTDHHRHLALGPSDGYAGPPLDALNEAAELFDDTGPGSDHLGSSRGGLIPTAAANSRTSPQHFSRSGPSSSEGTMPRTQASMGALRDAEAGRARQPTSLAGRGQASITNASQLASAAASSSTGRGAAQSPQSSTASDRGLRDLSTSPRTRSKTLGVSDRRRKDSVGSRPAFGAPPSTSRNDSVSLIDELAMNSPTLGAPAAEATFSSSGGGTFRDKMKKTSGFLRKLRGDSSSSGDKKGRRSGNVATGSAKPPQNSLTISRHESQTSFVSEAASSVALSTNTISSGPTLRSNTTQPSHPGQVPVPSIPSKYAKDGPVMISASSSSSTGEAPRTTLPGPPTPNLTPSPRARGSSRPLGFSSDPAPTIQFNGGEIVLPQRSSSQPHAHSQRLSDASTGDVRIVIRDWEHAMDDALKSSACDLEKKIELAPKAVWGPSPTLPDLDLSRYRERSGSFMEEGDVEERARQLKNGVRMEETSSSLPSTPKLKATDLRPALGAVPTSKSAQRSATYSFSGQRPNRLESIRSKSEEPVTPETTGLGIKHPATASVDSGSAMKSAPDIRRIAVRDHSGVERYTSEGQPPGQSQRSDSPSESLQTPRSSRRNSHESARQPYSSRPGHTRVGTSRASLTSAKSFETAAESVVMTLPDMAKRSFGDNTAEVSIAEAKDVEGDQTIQQLSRVRVEEESDDNDRIDPETSIRLITRKDPGLGAAQRGADEATTPVDANVMSLPFESSDDADASTTANGHDRLQSDGRASNGAPRDATTLVTQLPNGLSSIDKLPARGPSPSLVLPCQDVGPVSTSSSYAHSNRTLAAGSSNGDPLSPYEEDLASSNGDLKSSLDARGAELAAKCWAEDPLFLRKEKIAEWLGGIGLANKAARQAYFQNFQFEGLRIDVAFRRLCDKLFLRAETQQIDRILRAFSERYFECNPESVFGSADEVHSVVFSLLLLNTDLHIADIQDRMTRAQFIRNTMSAIAESRRTDDNNAFSSLDASRSSLNLAAERSPHTGDAISFGGTSPSLGSLTTRGKLSRSASTRSKARHSVRQFDFGSAGSEAASSPRPSLATLPPGIVVSGSKAGDVDLEILLKDIYAAVKSERILLPENGGLTVPGNQLGTTRRRAPGERMNALKRGSIRGIQGLLGASTSLSSDSQLAVSPGSMASRSSSDPWGAFAKQTSKQTSGATLSSNTATIGFASTLTQNIIREAQEEDTQSLDSFVDEVSDDELALMGPPWAKEGTLTRKHYWEAPGKRAKDKNWTEVFVVVQKGVLSMFKFGDTSSRSKQSQGPATIRASGGVMGGGNWLANATALGEVNLAHTLANVLPPPGYNRDRPHVFALTLPGGAVYFFQAGNEDLVQEWVQTCNYWAARQSKEPLPGGVSNMEYGWNKVLPSEDYEELDGGDDDDDTSLALSTSNAGSISTSTDASIYNSSNSGAHTGNADTRSLRSARSGRSTRVRARAALYQNLREAGFPFSGNGSTSSSGVNSSMASPAGSIMGSSGSGGVHKNERIFINDWKAPAMPTVASTLKEEDQLDRCLRHMAIIESDLTIHNELRQPMLQLYSPRGQNYAKALANWEKKSNHLLQELVKYQGYVESLKHSVKLRADQRGRREVEGMIRRADEEMSKVKEAEEGGPIPLNG